MCRQRSGQPHPQRPEGAVMSTAPNDPKVTRLAFERARKAKPGPAPNGEARLSTIRLKLGDLPAAVAACNEELAARSPAMFVFGEVLVTVENVKGRPVAIQATPTRIALELGRIAHFERVLKSEADGTLV